MPRLPFASTVLGLVAFIAYAMGWVALGVAPVDFAVRFFALASTSALIAWVVTPRAAA